MLIKNANKKWGITLTYVLSFLKIGKHIRCPYMSLSPAKPQRHTHVAPILLLSDSNRSTESPESAQTQDGRRGLWSSYLKSSWTLSLGVFSSHCTDLCSKPSPPPRWGGNDAQSPSPEDCRTLTCNCAARWDTLMARMARLCHQMSRTGRKTQASLLVALGFGSGTLFISLFLLSLHKLPGVDVTTHFSLCLSMGCDENPS